MAGGCATYMCVFVCTYIHMYIHRYIDTQIHRYTDTWIHTYTDTYILECFSLVGLLVAQLYEGKAGDAVHVHRLLDFPDLNHQPCASRK